MLARMLNHSDSRGGVCYFIYVCMCTNDVYFSFHAMVCRGRGRWRRSDGCIYMNCDPGFGLFCSCG